MGDLMQNTKHHNGISPVNHVTSGYNVIYNILKLQLISIFCGIKSQKHTTRHQRIIVSHSHSNNRFKKQPPKGAYK